MCWDLKDDDITALTATIKSKSTQTEECGNKTYSRCAVVSALLQTQVNVRHTTLLNISLVHFQTIKCASLTHSHMTCLSIRHYRPRQAAQWDSTHTHKSTLTHTLDLWPWPVLVQLTDIRQIYGASHEADWGHMECMWVHKYVGMPYASHRESEDRVSREGRSTLVMSRREQQQMNNMPFSSSTHCIISLTYINSTELWLLSAVSEHSLQ